MYNQVYTKALKLMVSTNFLSDLFFNFCCSTALRSFIVLLSKVFFIYYLVDPASGHTLFFKIKPCMSKCFVFFTLDCGRLIITVVVLLKFLFRWIPVVILELIHVTKNIYIFICILDIYFF